MAYHAHFFFQQFHARITGPSTEKIFIKLNTIPTTENKDKKLCTIFSHPTMENKDKKLYTIFSHNSRK